MLFVSFGKIKCILLYFFFMFLKKVRVVLVIWLRVNNFVFEDCIFKVLLIILESDLSVIVMLVGIDNCFFRLFVFNFFIGVIFFKKDFICFGDKDLSFL